MPRTRKLAAAVWTPVGEILCPKCAGFSPRYHEPDDEVGVVTCDHCAAYLLTDAKLAAEQRICKALDSAGFRQANMSQTGGMCSACSIPLPHLHDSEDPTSGGYVLVTADEDDPTVYNIGFYDNDTHYDGEYETLGRWGAAFDDVIGIVRSIVTATGGA